MGCGAVRFSVGAGGADGGAQFHARTFRQLRENIVAHFALCGCVIFEHTRERTHCTRRRRRRRPLSGSAARVSSGTQASAQSPRAMGTLRRVALPPFHTHPPGRKTWHTIETLFARAHLHRPARPGPARVRLAPLTLFTYFRQAAHTHARTHSNI